MGLFIRLCGLNNGSIGAHRVIRPINDANLMTIKAATHHRVLRRKEYITYFCHDFRIFPCNSVSSKKIQMNGSCGKNNSVFLHLL